MFAQIVRFPGSSLGTGNWLRTGARLYRILWPLLTMVVRRGPPDALQVVIDPHGEP